MPEALDRCVSKLKAQGKKESSAYAICTASLKKSGKKDEEFIDSLVEIEESSPELEELMLYAEEEGALLAWSAPTKRKDIPSSHFFDPKNKKYPYRNSDGSINCSGIMAAWKMANGARSGKKADSSIISKIKPYRDKCMKSKEKKQSEPHRFMFPVNLSSEIKLAENKPIEIEILKTGKWRHPWYGILSFDEKFFDSMIKNFELDIPQEKIAFDFKHNPDWGAAAWINGLRQEKGSLLAEVELTSRGRTAVEGKEFLYFSSEYTDDYSEYQFEEEESEDGTKVEKETKLSYGPTLLGGGLTNRPFIKGMKPVSLGEDGEHIMLEEVIGSPEKSGENINTNQENKNLEEVNEEMKKTLSELKAEQERITALIKELQEKKDKDSSAEAEKLNKELSEIKDGIKELQDAEDKKKKDKEVKELDDTKKELEDKKKELEDKEKTIKKLSEDVSSLTESVKTLMESRKELEEVNFKKEIESKIRQFQDMGVFPATIDMIKPMLLSSKSFSISLSEKAEDGSTKEIKKGLADILYDVFNSIPKEYRFSTEEKSESDTSPTGTGATLSEEDVQKFANENKLSYQEALIELSKQGKIQ